MIPLLCKLLLVLSNPIFKLLLLLSVFSILSPFRFLIRDPLLHVSEKVVDLSLPCVMFIFNLLLILTQKDVLPECLEDLEFTLLIAL